MTKFTDQLWRDLAHEHGPALMQAAGQGRTRRPRPRVLAGSTLAVAGAGAALALVLTSTSSTPAFAVTTNSNGSVTVTINQAEALPQANAKLTAMGIHEQVTIYMASGPAAVSGPVTCTPAPGVSGPAVKVLVGTNGTEVIKPGTSGDNTGVGTWHLASCRTTSGTGGTGGTGNTGAG
jgi:hypothetical protein